MPISRARTVVVGTANRLTADAVSTPGSIILTTPQDTNTTADITFKSTTAQVVQPHNTPVVTTQSGAGTGSPAVNAQCPDGTSTFSNFEFTCGTSPSAVAAIARLTFPTALKIAAGQIGQTCGVGQIVSAVNGAFLGTCYIIPVSSTVFDIYTDAALTTGAHVYITYWMFPF